MSQQALARHTKVSCCSPFPHQRGLHGQCARHPLGDTVCCIWRCKCCLLQFALLSVCWSTVVVRPYHVAWPACSFSWIWVFSGRQPWRAAGAWQQRR